MTFDGRRPLIEDDLWWKTTLDGRLPLAEENLWRKTTLDRRRPLTGDDLWQKTTIDKRRPLTEDNLWRKKTFDGRQPSIGCTVYYLKKKRLRLLTLTATARLTLNRKSYQLSKPEIEFHMMEEMYAALCMCTCAEKTTVFGKDDLTIVEWGEELHL